MKPIKLSFEQQREGRQILHRMEIRAAHQWAIALTGVHESGMPYSAPFGEMAWYQTLQTIRDLKRGRPLRPSIRNGNGRVLTWKAV